MMWTRGLKDLYPDLYSIAMDKDAFVHSYLEISNARGPRSCKISYSCVILIIGSWNKLTLCLTLFIPTSQVVRVLTV